MKCPLNGLCECDPECAWMAERYRKDGVLQRQCACVCGIGDISRGWSGNMVCISPNEVEDMLCKSEDDDVIDAQRQHNIFVNEARTPDSRDLLIGYRAQCAICGKSVLGSSAEAAIEGLKGETCK